MYPQHKPSKALPFVSVLYRQDLLPFSDILEILKKNFGEGIYWINLHFNFGKYYSKEMGEELELRRFFYVPIKLVDRVSLVQLKNISFLIEQEKLIEKNRTINLDPGLIAPEQMILATFKPFAHRIWLSDNIWQELTYIVKDGNYHQLPWTYPDYMQDEVKKFFDYCRQICLNLLK